MLKLAIDLDGTICGTKTTEQNYEDVVPLPGAIEALKQLKQDGHYIIIHTARHMRSQKANHGKILANFGYFYEWLKKWEIPYDEIIIGKPDVDLFLDDKRIMLMVQMIGLWNKWKSVQLYVLVAN